MDTHEVFLTRLKRDIKDIKARLAVAFLSRKPAVNDEIWAGVALPYSSHAKRDDLSVWHPPNVYRGAPENQCIVGLPQQGSNVQE
jgi:hypothetical protein